MNQINLSKEARDLVILHNIRPGIAAVWHDTLKQHFELYGANRMMTQKVEFDRHYLDMYVDQILKNYGGKIEDVKSDMDNMWKKQKTNYQYYLLVMVFISKAIDVIKGNN